MWDVDKCLKMNLLTICRETGRLKVNAQQTIFLLIRESDCLAKLNLPIPVVALTLLSKREHFTLLQDSLQVTLALQIILHY